MTLLARLARPLLAAPFIKDGIDAILHPEDHVDRFMEAATSLEKVGVPPVMRSDAQLLTRAAGVVSVGAGLMLATGRRPRTAALVLAGMNAVLTAVKNPVWETATRRERNEQWAGIAQGAALTGGLLLAAGDRGGKPSLNWRLGNWRDHRAALRAQKQHLREKYTA